MPQKSKTSQRKASSIAIAHVFRHFSDYPDAKSITTPPKQDAQFNIKKYGLHRYNLHHNLHKASETVAQRFGEPSTN